MFVLVFNITYYIVTAERASSRRPAPISLPTPASFTSNIVSSPERVSFDGAVPSHFSAQHRRVMSTPCPSTSSKLRITNKICPRKEKDKDKAAEPKPKSKPARTQPYGPPYNWIPPTPGAWAVAEVAGIEETDGHQGKAIGRRRKRVSAPAESNLPRFHTA